MLGGILPSLHVRRCTRQGKLVRLDIVVELSPRACIPAVHLPPCTREPPGRFPAQGDVALMPYIRIETGGVELTIGEQEVWEYFLTVLGVDTSTVDRMKLLCIPGAGGRTFCQLPKAGADAALADMSSLITEWLTLGSR
jgi:hypothetical protein